MIPFNICIIIATILTVLALAAIAVFVMPKGATGFCAKLRGFLTFRKLYIETLLRVMYIVGTVASVCFGLVLLLGKVDMFWETQSTWATGLMLLVVNPILLRLIFEGLMLTVIRTTNVIAIRNLLDPENGDKVTFSKSDGKLAAKIASGAAKAAENIAQRAKDDDPTAGRGDIDN